MFGYLASMAFYTNISKYIFNRIDENKSDSNNINCRCRKSLIICVFLS